jgi:hypothetical protein
MQTLIKLINKSGINKFAKEKFPKIFKSMRDVIMAKNDAAFQETKRKISDTLATIFKNDMTVRNGPFKDMVYTNSFFCVSLFPKIIGGYEEPIQGWINEAIGANYNNIINIGSAEGYYSVGFARTSKNSKIYAYDIKDEELAKNKTLAKINGVEDKITFKNICTNEELDRVISDKTLIICDIEGAEKMLLDPKKSSNLKLADLIVESHDCYVKNITELLIQRFYRTHRIEIIVDYPRDLTSALPYSTDMTIARSLIEGKRSSVSTKWLRMKKT